MRTSNTFSVLFWVNSEKASNGYALLYARVCGLKPGFPVHKYRKSGGDRVPNLLHYTFSVLFGIARMPIRQYG